MLNIDFHSHILPGMDDGARNPVMSKEMVELLVSQGIDIIFATSHFRKHKDTVEDFCEKRSFSLSLLNDVLDDEHLAKIRFGAEVAIERNLCEIEDLASLAYENTNCILLELPYRPYASWITEEITNISYEHGLIPVIAHVDRYTEIYSDDDYREIFSIDRAIFQVNNEGFLQKSSKALIKNMISEDLPFILGSDSHNMSDRMPNFDVPGKYLKKYTMNSYAADLRDYILSF